MTRLNGFVVALALVTSSMCRADPTPLDVSTLAAAERRWAHASLQNYRFTFRYHEFVSPCESWGWEVRVVHGVPERGGNCPQYRPQFASVPLLFKYLHRALKKRPYQIEAEFDSTLGYPRSASIAWSDMADDFFAFEVGHFSSSLRE